MREFHSMVEQLRDVGVQVVVFDYPVGEIETPDAVFPNIGSVPLKVARCIPFLWLVRIVSMKLRSLH